MAAGAERRPAPANRPRAVVTGGHGFIGAWVVGRLVAEGFRVLVIDRQPEGREGVDAISADIAAPEAGKALVAYKPDLVVHAAAQTKVSRSVADPIEDARVNVGGTLAMLEAAREAGASGFVFFSSAAVYGEPRRLPLRESHPARPLSPYGLSKLAASAYVDHYRIAGRLPAVTLIPANAYGPGQGVGSDGAVVAAFMRAAARGEPLALAGDGGQTRDFVYVEDIVEAVWLAWRWLELLGRLPGGRFNVGTGTQTRVADLASLVEQVAGRRLEKAAAPRRAGDIRRSCLDPSLARATFGWAPKVDLAEGLRRTYGWWQLTAAARRG